MGRIYRIIINQKTIGFHRKDAKNAKERRVIDGSSIIIPLGFNSDLFIEMYDKMVLFSLRPLRLCGKYSGFSHAFPQNPGTDAIVLYILPAC